MEHEELAALALKEFAEAFTRRSVLVDKPDEDFKQLMADATPVIGQTLEQSVQLAARELAKSCNRRKVSRFAVPELPGGVEYAAAARDHNSRYGLRVIKAFDMVRGRMVARVNVLAG